MERRRLDTILRSFPSLRIAVIGDFFLDAYFDCDQALNETSLETGRDCYQVVQTRRQAGAAGTVVTNLAALGAGTVEAVGFCGEDGEGFELTRCLRELGVGLDGFRTVHNRVTPTYNKPCFVEPDGRSWRVAQELERIDVKNRRATPRPVVAELTDYMESNIARWDAVIIVDQVGEPDCGAVTTSVRRCLTRLRREHPETVMLADSRHRIGAFAGLPIKPNHHEGAAALGQPSSRSVATARRQAVQLSGPSQRPVFMTMSERGMIVCVAGTAQHVPGFAVTDRPIDPVGAGDSTTAMLACALAAGSDPLEAAWLANLTGSITVQQIGTTGTATPRQIRRRWKEVATATPSS